MSAAPLSTVQATSAISFEDLVRASLGSDLAWDDLTRDASNRNNIRHLLTDWKRDIKSQRTMSAGRVAAGATTAKEHAVWLGRTAGFERMINRRLGQIGHTLESVDGGRRQARLHAANVSPGKGMTP